MMDCFIIPDPSYYERYDLCSMATMSCRIILYDHLLKAGIRSVTRLQFHEKYKQYALKELGYQGLHPMHLSYMSDLLFQILCNKKELLSLLNMLRLTKTLTNKISFELETDDEQNSMIQMEFNFEKGEMKC